MVKEEVFSVKFTREQRAGIVALLVLMVLIQLGYYAYCSYALNAEEKLSENELDWLSQQRVIDSLKLAKSSESGKVYPFNPNFISDYKGYVLGMSLKEIDRLHKFRAENKFANSAEEFQNVTKVSDEWLKKYAPYFKFPDWVKNRKASFVNYDKGKFQSAKKEKIVVLDINKATQEDLMKVYGIGPALSERILKEREKFGAFLSMNQLKEVWGLSPEVVEKLQMHFKIISVPEVKKIAINEASIKEMQQFPYFRYALAREIVTYRSMQGAIKTKEDLQKIKNFPVDKVDIIALYLEF
ncbi:helix-hairpin-helix domain-containing protein [Flavobacterium sp.]|uniref:ComEA family DNA-binding protein n=1 Tax=Flavobacterium sp. TaxID=239 RepID=UPI0028BD7359|nr:helix-hairpin-helix domain-containing protein [Flavobacterium sp.]